MINQRIKSKRMAAKVAKELQADLIEELDCFGSYKVDMEAIGCYHDITITSPSCTCNIITSCVIKRIIGVAEVYCKQYQDITYHFDVAKDADKYIPAFVIQISYKEK